MADHECTCISYTMSESTTNPEEKRKNTTFFTRSEKIYDRYGRNPTANELRALQNLPLEKSNDFYSRNRSPIDIKIYQLLELSEQSRNISLLEEAGRLLWEQATRPYIAESPVLSFTYPPTFLSGHEFAKTELPSQIEYTESKFGKMTIAQSKSGHVAAVNLNEDRETLSNPKSTPYSDKLVNIPDRRFSFSAATPNEALLNDSSGIMANPTEAYSNSSGESGAHSSTTPFSSIQTVVPAFEKNSLRRLAPQHDIEVAPAMQPESYNRALFCVRPRTDNQANE